MKQPVKRMICSNPDRTCLQGGCGYCNHFGAWQSIEKIRQYAEEKKLMFAFNWGLENDFANAQVKYDDGSLKF